MRPTRAIRRAEHMRWSEQAPKGGVTYGQRFFLALDGTPRSELAHGVRFLFTGRECLAPVNLYDYRHRADSPTLVRRFDKAVSLDQRKEVKQPWYAVS